LWSCAKNPGGNWFTHITLFPEFNLSTPVNYLLPQFDNPNELFCSSEGEMFYTHWDESYLTGKLVRFKIED
jgi:hypothetical protein